MSSYGLYCTVCKEVFECRDSWTAHLLTGFHQSPARLECLQWSRKERKCSIVVFADKPVAMGSSLLEYFSLKGLETIVTDFVWWPNRPRVALLQFESRKKVKQVLRELGKPELQLPDCFVQFKDAKHYLDVEWNELICKGSVSDMDIPKPSQASEYKEKTPVLLSKSGNACLRDDIDSGGKDGVLVEPALSEDVSVTVTTTSSNLATVETNQDIPDSTWALRVSEFNDLCKSVMVPDSEYKKLMDVINRVRRIFGSEYDVNMYRNLILQLRNPGSDILLLHVTPKDSEFVEDEIGKEDGLLATPWSQTVLPGFQRMSTDKKERCELGGSIYRNPYTRIHFVISCDPLRSVEVQVGRILKYLCSFDPCVKPLFSLVYIWARANHLNLSENSIRVDISNGNSNLPDPVALDWLLILFLIRMGIVPSVRNVQERSPLENPTSFCSEFVEEWKKNRSQDHLPQQKKNSQERELILKVLRLISSFFEFLEELWSDERQLVLNPKDGEIFSRDELFSYQCKTKISSQEIVKLQNVINEPDKKDVKLYMIHPLCLRWKLSVCNENIKKHVEVIRDTASGIKEFVNKYCLSQYSHEELNLEEVLVGQMTFLARKKLAESKKIQDEIMHKKAELRFAVL